MGKISDFRTRQSAFADLLPYAAVIDDGIILNKNGSLMVGWKIKGMDVESATKLERNSMAARLNAVFARLGSGYMLHVDSVRRDSRGYPSRKSSHFPDPISEAIDEERRRSFEGHGVHFETDTYLVLSYMPPEFMKSKFVNAMYSTEGGDNQQADTTLKDFKADIAEIHDLLDNVLDMERLGAFQEMQEWGERVTYDTFLAHINTCISGVDQPIILPSNPMYLDALFARDFVPAITPKIGDKFIGVVGIEGFPQESSPAILQALDSLSMEYRWSTRFIFMDPIAAKARLESYRKKWKGAATSLLDQVLGLDGKPKDGDALAMSFDAEESMAEAASGQVRYGYYTTNVLVYSDDRVQMEKQLAFLRRQINNLGFVARIETINANDAYIGSLPGQGYANVRRPVMHTLNLSHLLPVNSVFAGREHNPCPFYPPESPPLMQVATAGSTPFRLNLHVRDVGHTMIFGPTGSGKSTLLGLIAAQFRRYPNAQIFAFDKGRSILPLTLAVGGEFYDLDDDNSDVMFCPLGSVESDMDQAWAEDWIISILMLQNVEITPAVRNTVHDAMTAVRQSEAAPTMSNFVSSLQSMELREALETYTVGGQLGSLLDTDVDTFSENRFIAVEMEDLMNMGEAALMPVLLYLFHRIEKRLDGSPSMIILDEAWVMLGHEAFRDKIREWLKVLRRKNCAVLLATQSLSDAANSGILDVLTESCPTKILLPNPEALTPRSQAFYEDVGLNSRQIEIVAGATQKREYYVISTEGRRLFDMELGPYALAFVGASGAEDLSKIKELYQAFGSDWTERWLKERGVLT